MCEVRWCRDKQVVVFYEGKGLCFKHWELSYLGKIKLNDVLR